MLGSELIRLGLGWAGAMVDWGSGVAGPGWSGFKPGGRLGWAQARGRLGWAVATPGSDKIGRR